ncbi:MAG: DUF6817 domain-containing protein [Gemmatimonadales bacterium]
MPADDPMYQRALELLERFGAVSVEHPSGTLLEHLRGTYEQLDRWGCSKDLCRAGLYHSVYGTEKFQKRTVPLEARNEVRSANRGTGRGDRLPLLRAIASIAVSKPRRGRPLRGKDAGRRREATQPGGACRSDDPGPCESPRAASPDEA